jgi:hypothetical protein
VLTAVAFIPSALRPLSQNQPLKRLQHNAEIRTSTAECGKTHNSDYIKPIAGNGVDQGRCNGSSRSIPLNSQRPKLLILVPQPPEYSDSTQAQAMAKNLSQYCTNHGYIFKLHNFEANFSLAMANQNGAQWKSMLTYW